MWRPPSLSELTQMLFNTGLTHLGSEVSMYLLGIGYLSIISAPKINFNNI